MIKYMETLNKDILSNLPCMEAKVKINHLLFVHSQGPLSEIYCISYYKYLAC